MADNDAYLRLRRMTGEVDSDTYNNIDLDAFLKEADNDFNVAAALVWGEKASAYADLVNITEAGSSRSNSDLFKHAKEQQVYFSDLGGVATTTATPASTTRRIVRR